jgi:hypothetical protein
MILHVLADASYLSRSHARSVAGAYLFLGNHLQPTKINGAIHCFSTIIPCVVASAGEEKRQSKHQYLAQSDKPKTST